MDFFVAAQISLSCQANAIQMCLVVWAIWAAIAKDIQARLQGN